MGAKTGLYAAPLRGDGHAGVAEPSGAPVYRVQGGLIEIKGRQYPIRLPDGLYIIRKLTPTECERLMALPDGYTAAPGVSDTQRYRMCGNGWEASAIIHLLRHALAGVGRGERIQVLSLYDGMGTGRYCLDMLGFKDVEYHAYEIDKFAARVAQRNYPDITQCGDAFAVRDAGWGWGKEIG
jgi:DNA (cytosine-5)-methyltransferase 3A